MIKNTLKAITDYSEMSKQTKGVYDQAMEYIRTNYKEESSMYNSAVETAKSTYNSTVAPLKKECMEIVQKDFEAVRSAIKKAVSVPPTDSVVNLLSVIQSGKMTEAEKQMVLEQYSHNYMDAKLLHTSMGIDFVTVDDLMDEIKELEAPINKYFSESDFDSYNARLMLHGEWINKIDDATDEFISTYSSTYEE